MDLSKDCKREIREGRKKGVTLNSFRYTDFKGNTKITNEIEDLINRIYRYAFEEKVIQTRKLKEYMESRKHGAIVACQNLELERIPTLYMRPKYNNLGKFV